MKKKLLVMDVGGVLATNLSPNMWLQLAQIGQCDHEWLYTAYKQEISKKLWCGDISEAYFWQWLKEKGIELDEQARTSLIHDNLIPLPSLKNVARWSQQCSIIIMSNHRSEWLMPLLAPYADYFLAVHISDQAGLCKPDLRWFKQLQRGLESDKSIMFIDDSIKNVHAAQQCGWQAVHANQAGSWTATVDEWLRSS